MTRLSLKDYSQRFFKALIWSWCYFVLFTSSAPAAEETQLCVDCQKEPPVINVQNFENDTHIKQELNINSQQNCFDQLTDNDKAFLEKILIQISEHCGVEGVAMKPKSKPLTPLKRLPASSEIDTQLERVSPDCATSAQSMIFKEIEDYGKNFGTAAKKRVSTAMLAQFQGLQMANILRDFEDPAMALGFQKFTEAVRNYDQSLKRLIYQDLKGDKSDSSSLKESILSWLSQKSSTVSWLYQRGSMAKDLFLTKTNLGDKTRFREHEKAAEKLLFSGVALNKKIQSSHFSAEKKSNLINQVKILNNLMRDRYNKNKNTLNEEVQVAKLATGGFVSAVLVVASLGSYSPSLLWAGPAADFLTSSLSTAAYSAIGATGVSGIVETSKIILGSKTAAKDNASRFLCELAKKMHEEGDKSLETIWKTALNASQIGFGVGATANVLSRHSKIREYGIFMTILGAFVGLNVAEVKSKLDKGEDIDGERAHARLQYEAGKLSYGELVDKISEANQKDANNNAELMRHGINISRLTYISNDVVKAIATEKVKAETILNALKNIESQLGRKFTEKQNTTVMNIFNLRMKEQKTHEKFSEQELKAINDLRSAGFAPNEIQSILNVNINTIIPSSNSK